jgi:poly(3-hydroxybutyrate) depolymerase
MGILCGASTHTLQTEDKCTSCQERTFHLYLPTSLCNASSDEYEDTFDISTPNPNNISAHILPSTDLNDIGIQTLPLVFAVHSYTQTAEILNFWINIAQEFNFVLVRPQGYQNSWNANVCCGEALKEDVNDEGFFSQIITNLTDRFSFLDVDHVSAMGWSNGGFMVSSVAHLFQAVAPISGYQYNTSDYVNIANNYGGDDSDVGKSNRSVAWFQHHGLSDRIIAFEGCCLDPKEGGGGKVCSVLGEYAGPTCTSANFAFISWASEVNQCTNVTLLSKNNKLNIECWQGEECASNTTFCSYGGNYGHFIGGAFENAFPSEMTNEIAHFFARDTCEKNDGKWIRENMTCECSQTSMIRTMYCFVSHDDSSEDDQVVFEVHTSVNASDSYYDSNEDDQIFFEVHTSMNASDSYYDSSEDDQVVFEVDTSVNAFPYHYFTLKGIQDLQEEVQLQPYFILLIFPLVLIYIYQMRRFSRSKRTNKTPDLNPRDVEIV